MRYMAATDDVVYRGWVTYKLKAGGTRTAYFGPYSLETTAKGVVSNKIRSWGIQNAVIARGVHEARFEWKPVDSDPSGEA